MTYYSIPSGKVFTGDEPQMVEREVKDRDGRVIMKRKVYEDGFDPGYDADDGLHFNHGRLEKIHSEFDRDADTNTVRYRVQEPGANRGKEIVAVYERDNDGKVVLARYREVH